MDSNSSFTYWQAFSISQSNNIRLHIMIDKFIGFDGQNITQLSYIQLNALPFV